MQPNNTSISDPLLSPGPVVTSYQSVEPSAPPASSAASLPINVLPSEEDKEEQPEGVPNVHAEKFKRKHPKITTVVSHANDYTQHGFVIAFAFMADYLCGQLCKMVEEAQEDPEKFNGAHIALVTLQVLYAVYYLAKAGWIVFNEDRNYNQALLDSQLFTEEQLAEMASTKVSKALPLVNLFTFGSFLTSAALLSEGQFVSGVVAGGVATIGLVTKSVLDMHCGKNDYKTIAEEEKEFQAVLSSTELKAGVIGLAGIIGGSVGLFYVGHAEAKDNHNPHTLTLLLSATAVILGVAVLTNPLSMIGTNARTAAIEEKVGGVYANHAVLFNKSTRRDTKNHLIAALGTGISAGVLIAFLHHQPTDQYSLLYALAATLALAGTAHISAQTYAADSRAIRERLLFREKRVANAELLDPQGNCCEVITGYRQSR